LVALVPLRHALLQQPTTLLVLLRLFILEIWQQQASQLQ
jgi:hypothetical protein